MQANAVNDYLYGTIKIIYFIVVFGLILAVAYFTTKFLAKRGMVNNKNKSIKVVESISMGIDKNIVLIKAGSQYFLVASTPKSLSLLAEIDKDKLFEQGIIENVNGNITEENNELDNSNKSFSEIMQYNLKKIKTIVRGNKIDEK